jgi:hypothetical protein
MSAPSFFRTPWLFAPVRGREEPVGGAIQIQRGKSFPAIRKGQSRTGFKALVSFQKGFGNKASDVPRFSDINAKKQGFMLKQWNGLESLFR